MQWFKSRCWFVRSFLGCLPGWRPAFVASLVFFRHAVACPCRCVHMSLPVVLLPPPKPFTGLPQSFIPLSACVGHVILDHSRWRKIVGLAIRDRTLFCSWRIFQRKDKRTSQPMQSALSVLSGSLFHYPLVLYKTVNVSFQFSTNGHCPQLWLPLFLLLDLTFTCLHCRRRRLGCCHFSNKPD